MKKVFGPLIRKNLTDKWHWYNDCPKLDKDAEEFRIAGHKAVKKELCELCFARFETNTGQQESRIS